MELNGNGMRFSDQERAALKLFRPIAEKIVGDTQAITVDNEYLIRWLRARNLSIEKAEHMLQTSMEWRAKVEIETVFQYRAPEIIENHFRYKFAGEDANGRPILFAQYSRWDIRGVIDLGMREELLHYMRRLLEELMLEISKRRERGVTQFVAVLDSETLSFRDVTHMGAFRAALQFLSEFEANYPEILHSCYVLNASSIFQMAFTVLKPLLSGRTLSKLEVYDGSNCGNKWKAVLRERLPSDAIPCEFGGTGPSYFSND